MRRKQFSRALITLLALWLALQSYALAEAAPSFGGQIVDISGMALGEKGLAAHVVGLDGVQQSMAEWLALGSTVRLTVDSALQAVVEKELAAAIALAQRGQPEAKAGAAVVMDMQGRVLAMASFPSQEINHAIATRDTTGLLMEVPTALAALAEGALTTTELISDGGLYDMYSYENPARCWIPQNRLHNHANMAVVEGLSHSCFYFFYTLASRLGADGEQLHAFCRRAGLTGLTGVELPGEAGSIVGSQASLYDPERPLDAQDTDIPMQVHDELVQLLAGMATPAPEKHAACADALMRMAHDSDQGAEWEHWKQEMARILIDALDMPEETAGAEGTQMPLIAQLNRIKWGGTHTIQTSIGQFITQTTPLGMARFLAAVANGGFVYDTRIVDAILSPEGDVIVSFDEPSLKQNISEEIGNYIPYISQGLYGLIDYTGQSVKYIIGEDGWRYLDQVSGMVSAGVGGLPEKGIAPAWFAGFAPYDVPEIALVIYIQHGETGAYTATAAKNILTYYLESQGW